MFNLTFSDSAKFAQAALNLIRGQGLQVSHSLFSSQLLSSFSPGTLFPVSFLPLPSWILSFVFKFFPATDNTIAFIGLKFFLLSVLLVFFIGKKLHSVKAGLVSATLFLSTIFFQEYAHNFASEILFIFEILLFVYLLLLPKKFKLLSLIPLAAMFYTRQQASVFLGSFLIALLFVFITKVKKIKWRLVITAISVIILGIFINYSAIKISGSFNIGASSNFGSYIRGGEYQSLGLTVFASKIFYNFYNFLKAPERLASPVVFFLFIFNLFIKPKNIKLRWFNPFTLISLSLFTLAASATLPNARYVHPIIPLVMIAASIGLVELVKNIPVKLQNFSLIALMFFITLPTIGYYTLDARARAQQFNIGQPLAHKQIASVMAENIPKGHLIITNLDAWAAWYEGLTTMWFPLEINMLEGHQDKVDYIVITNYKENDGDFALGEWNSLLNQPSAVTNIFIKEYYHLIKTIDIKAEQIYENQPYYGVIYQRN
jgi:4-amino-4-deoxy-L-arabinose transferase-like glycosyltransferase